MTNPNSSHITLVVDRSGSMQSVLTDAEGAVNAFIADQQKEPTSCTLVLADFDAKDSAFADDPWYHVRHDGDLQTAPQYKLLPRGWTALNDALGRAISDTGTKLAALAEENRPGKVFIVIQTDGGENASTEWTHAKLVEAIKRQEDDFAWTFIFLGAGPAAWGAADSFVGTKMHLNSVKTGVGGQSMAAGYATTSTAMRSARAGGQNVAYGATVDEDGNVV